MKKTLQGTLLLSTLLLGYQVQASESGSIIENHWSIGVGSYAFVLANDNDSADDLDFSGFNVAAGYAVNNHFQIRGTYFSLENDSVYHNGYNNYTTESKGYDLMAYGGVGFSKKGFRGYGGAGFFSDKMTNHDKTISGFQAGGGLGYNWGPVGLDFVLTLRKADEYEDFAYKTGTYVAMSGNLTVSYLF